MRKNKPSNQTEVTEIGKLKTIGLLQKVDDEAHTKETEESRWLAFLKNYIRRQEASATKCRIETKF